MNEDVIRIGLVCYYIFSEFSDRELLASLASPSHTRRTRAEPELLAASRHLGGRGHPNRVSTVLHDVTQDDRYVLQR
jgi:hypothetical protein